MRAVGGISGGGFTVASHEQLAIDLEGIQDWGTALNGVRIGMQPVAPASGDHLGTDPASTAVETGLAYFDQAWSVGCTIIDSYMAALSKMCDDSVAKIRQLDASLAPQPHGLHNRAYED